jgi:hypothetical protein
MPEQKETHSGFVGFFGTLPGIITAVAGLITALVAAGPIGSAVSGPSDPVPPATTSQVPPAGSVAVDVPNVVQWPIDEAIGELESLEFRVVVTPQASDEVPEGFVTSQHPPPGTPVEAGTSIQLWESTGTADIL